MRERWERINLAQRRGTAMPPIDVYRIGDMHFVKDGHHRVSVARALGHRDINAYVTEVLTQVGADHEIRMRDLPLKSHERLFYDRVPLPPEARERIHLKDEWTYAALAEAVEAWGFRVIQARQQPMSRHEVAEAWFREEYEPVVAMLDEAQPDPQGRDRHRGVHARRRAALHDPAHARVGRSDHRRDPPGPRAPRPDDDTLVRRLRRELR